MKTKDFIKLHCFGCDDFCGPGECGGCHSYLDEECDEAFCHPLYRGKKMVDRVNEYCHSHDKI